MKLNFIIKIITLLLICSKAYSQTYVSEKQTYYFAEKEIDNEKIFNDNRTFIVSEDTYFIEMPDNKIITGRFKKVKIEETNEYKYEMEKGGFFQIGDEKIFMNLYKTDYKCIVNFYLDNGYEIDKKKRNETVTENNYQSNIRVFGEFTAKCIKDKEVRVGMKRIAIVLILGQPNEINETETKSMLSEQWVYENQYVYTENGIVTTIQTSR